MADDQHQPRGDDPEAVDRTRQFAAFDDAQDGDGTPGGRPPGGPSSADPAATTAMPATPGTPPLHPDRTAPLHRAAAPDATAPDATAPIPRSDATAALPPAGPVWSGRAEVRPPVTRVVRTAEPAGWEAAGWEAEERSGRSWWMPIVVALLALLLIGLLGFGVWLITRSTAGSDVPVVPSRSAARTTAASPTPTRPSPSPRSPTPAAPQEVEVPPLVGLSSGQAQATLDAMDLTYRLVFRPSDQPPDTVIETDPEAGAELPTGGRVTLVISAAVRTNAPAPSSPAASPTTPAAPTP